MAWIAQTSGPREHERLNADHSFSNGSCIGLARKRLKQKFGPENLKPESRIKNKLFHQNHRDRTGVLNPILVLPYYQPQIPFFIALEMFAIPEKLIHNLHFIQRENQRFQVQSPTGPHA
jgi:hypothetical protein